MCCCASQIHELLREADEATGAGATNGLQNGARHSAALTEADLEGLLSALYTRKQALQQQSAQDSLQLLLHFLQYSRSAIIQIPPCTGMHVQDQTLDEGQPQRLPSVALEPLRPTAVYTLNMHVTSIRCRGPQCLMHN